MVVEVSSRVGRCGWCICLALTATRYVATALEGFEEQCGNRCPAAIRLWCTA